MTTTKTGTATPPSRPWEPPSEDAHDDDMRAPTLADAVLRRTFMPEWRDIIDPGGEVRPALLASKRYTLDVGMSAFMADLAYAPLVAAKGDRKRVSEYLEGMRAHARLPFPSLWIEYDAQAKRTRAATEYNAPMDITIGPYRCGWLVQRHPTLETAFKATEFASHAWTKGDKRIYAPQPCCFAMAWRTDDGPPPWPRLSMFNEPPSTWLSGILTYETPCVEAVRAFMSDEMMRAYWNISTHNLMQEMSSDLRYLWALLATLTRLPTRTGEVRAAKGFVARGSYRRFMDHTTITLHVPTARYRAVARHALAPTRRKRGEVQGHWRRAWRHPALAGCEHVWGGDATHTECKICGGRRVWVREHERGDAGLGWVSHAYRVTRGETR